MECDRLVGRQGLGSKRHVADVVAGLGVVRVVLLEEIVHERHQIALELVDGRVGIPGEDLLADAVLGCVQVAEEVLVGHSTLSMVRDPVALTIWFH